MSSTQPRSHVLLERCLPVSANLIIEQTSASRVVSSMSSVETLPAWDFELAQKAPECETRLAFERKDELPGIHFGML